MKNTQPQDYQVWQSSETAKTFLEGVRAAIPLANEQINTILRLIKLTQPQVNNFLDLGCGDGILGRAIAQTYPESLGVFLDMSETMLEAAKSKIDNQKKYKYILQDLAREEWLKQFENLESFEVIVSGFAIHHLPDLRKKQLYQEIFTLLKPGGIFLNLEHVASQSPLGEKAFDELFIDSLYSYHQSKGTKQTKEEIDKQYYSRSDKTANILAPTEKQSNWLREIGFTDVDCFIKIFEIALFGGLKPI